jgi:hypothetical protein
MIAALTPIHEDRRRKPTLEVCPRTAEHPQMPPAPLVSKIGFSLTYDDC